jgi:hypothetical protein
VFADFPRIRVAALVACLLTGLAMAGCTGGAAKGGHACSPSATGGGQCTVWVPGFANVTKVSATSANDQWFFELDHLGKTFAEHWDGRAWHRVPIRVPQGYTPEDATAGGPADVWVVSRDDNDLPAPLVFSHWDGHAWTNHPAAPWRYPGTPETPRPYFGTARFLPAVSPAGGLWAMEERDGARLERWDGHDWRAVEAPGIYEDNVAAPALPGPAEVWLASDAVLDHWTGTAWQRLTLPTGVEVDTLAIGPGGDLWVSVHPPRSTRDLSPPPHQLQHLEGSSWRQVPVTSRLGLFDGGLAADGKGGLWLSVSPSLDRTYFRPGSFPPATVDRLGLHGAVGGLVHRAASGVVTEVAGPRPSYATLALGAPTYDDKWQTPPWQDHVSTALMAVLPGTGTVWFQEYHVLDDPRAYGSDEYISGDVRLLQRYRPRP